MALPDVAREAVQAALERRPPAHFSPLGRAGAVFVTLRIDGALRGCMGMMTPQRDDLIDETMDRARAAAFDDPRFDKLTAIELARCEIEVTILGALESAGESDLDPDVFGVEVVDASGRRGVLLPGIDGIDSVQEQLRLVRRKGRIPPDEPLTIRRFRATSESD